MKAQVSQWGNSLGVRIPKEVATRLGFAEGQQVFIDAHEDHIRISRALPPRRLEDLLVGVTPAAFRDAFDSEFDWGPDRGREAFD